MSLALRFIAVACLVYGAVVSIRRSGFSSRDRRQLAWILGISALLVGGVIAYVVWVVPGPGAGL